MKLQHLKTIQTCHCHRMSKTWHHDMPQHSAILRSPPHTRPWRTRHQSGYVPNWCLWWTCLSSVPRPRPGGSDRLRLASRSWFLPSKPDHWNPTNNLHSTERYRISLIQNLEKQSPFSIYIFADNSTRSEMNDETIKHLKNHPNLSLSEDVENIPSWHAAAFSDSAEPTTHQALAPSSPIWLDTKVMFVMDAFVFSASAKAWRQTDEGWRLVRGSFGQNLISEMLKRKDIQLRHVESLGFKTWKKQSRNPLDPRWKMKLQHLQTIQISHCQRMSKPWHHEMPQHSAILRSPPHTRPWRPRHQSVCHTQRCLWRMRLSWVPRPRPGGSDRSRLSVKR